MNTHEWLAEGFEEHRGHLRAVAYRMLGSRTGADDAVQEAWFRLNRSEASGIKNLWGWLTTAYCSRVRLKHRQGGHEKARRHATPAPGRV